MEVRRCMKCMHPLAAGETVCPECGRAYGSVNAESFALKPGTILEGKYLVGEMLGQGGFGITYIGFDLLLEQKVAIKEYYPMSTGMVSREGHSTVVWSSAMMGKTGTQKGFDSFLREARKMAKLGGIPGVVGVKSVFIQNETAYIVMDFIEGETLLKKLQKNGPMDFDSCVKLMTPIMQALSEVHEHGIIHRDISPDNIMVRPDGKLILLDLGAAKDLDIQGNDGSVQSSQMVAKHGFSPIEQYSKSGKVGPWTDIYAMAATIYYCCTGILPPPATDRTIDDTLACQPRLTQAQFDILADCMHMRPQDRPQSMDTLLQMLTHPQGEVKAEPPKVIPEVEPPKPVETKAAPPKPMETEPVAQKTQPINPEAQPTQPPRHDVKPERPLSKWLIPGVAAVVAVIALAISIGSGGKKSAPAPSVKVPTVQTAAEPAPTKAVPAVPMEVHTMAAADFVYEDDISATPFWGQSQYLRKDVNTLTFQSSLQNAPSSAWDVSEAGDRSVLAWMDNGNLYVAADGAIAPNPDAAWLFQDFVNMKTINFGNCFDTSDVTRMRGMFNGCSSLTDLDLSGFDTSSVTDMRMMFQNCASLTSLDLPGFDTSSVTDMRVMFQNCANLTSLDVSSFDTSNVIDMGAMFANCERLTGLDLSGFDTSHVTNMAAMFCICEDLTSLDLTGFDTSNVADMSNMFRSCTSLTNLNLSSFDASAVTKMDSMFYGCDNLPDIICPDSKILKEFRNR
ncbi:MAG: BspA family leucine-rich repeat surface protein [Oscillospiraceae bacterium]